MLRGERTLFRRFEFWGIVVFLLTTFLLLPPPAAAVTEIYRVTVTGGAETRDGSSWVNAMGLTEFRDKIVDGNVAGGDEFWVAAGTYTPHDSDRSTSFQMKSGVALYGGFSGGEENREERNPGPGNNETILSGNIGDAGSTADNSYNVVTANGVSDTAVLDGFTITEGNASGSGGNTGGGMHNSDNSNPTITNCIFFLNRASNGGGMRNNASSPKITDCTFSDNTALTNAGGMYNSNSSPTITNCIFSGNTATNGYGGGMFNDTNSSPTLMGCTFSGNSGGGMYNGSSSPTITSCTFSNNTITNKGGGMFNYYCSPNTAITNCTFSNNTASYGGGMHNEKSNPTITNCTFSNNTASYGGGICNLDDAHPIVTNCTFSGNNAADGRGMYNFGTSNSTVKNSIFWSGDPGTTVGQISAQNAPSTSTFSYSVTDQSGTGNTPQDPKLGALADNGGPTWTCLLGEESSALDTGDPATDLTGPLSKDQRGVTRPQPTGGTVDMGAVEMQKQGTLTVTLAPTGAVTAGAQWSVDGGTTWRDSGTSPNLVTGAYTITYKDVANYTKPADEEAEVTANSDTAKTGTYTTATPTVAPTSVPPGPDPEPTAVPTVAPTVAPTAAPTPVPVQPADPPVIPTETPLPENTEPKIAVPLVVTLPPEATPEERKDALRETLREALIPEDRIESILELLDIDSNGQVYITQDGMDQLRSLLEDLEIPEGAENGPLAVFKASLGEEFSGMRLAGSERKAALFFSLPEGFIGKTADRVHVVKMLASDEAVPFTQIFAMEDLKDGCSAVAEVEQVADGSVLKRLLASKDLVTADCLVALAIMDGGSFDLDGMVNDSITDPAFVIEAEAKESPEPDPEPSQGASGGGGGCSMGAMPLGMLLLALPLLLLKK